MDRMRIYLLQTYPWMQICMRIPASEAPWMQMPVQEDQRIQMPVQEDPRMQIQYTPVCS